MVGVRSARAWHIDIDPTRPKISKNKSTVYESVLLEKISTAKDLLRFL